MSQDYNVAQMMAEREVAGDALPLSPREQERQKLSSYMAEKGVDARLRMIDFLVDFGGLTFEAASVRCTNRPLVDIRKWTDDSINHPAPDFEVDRHVLQNENFKIVYGGDEVNHPPHYNQHPSGIECIQVTEHMCFNLGNAIKYIWRADLKGNSDQDIEKAIWFLKREQGRRKSLRESSTNITSAEETAETQGE